MVGNDIFEVGPLRADHVNFKNLLHELGLAHDLEVNNLLAQLEQARGDSFLGRQTADNNGFHPMQDIVSSEQPALAAEAPTEHRTQTEDLPARGNSDSSIAGLLSMEVKKFGLRGSWERVVEAEGRWIAGNQMFASRKGLHTERPNSAWKLVGVGEDPERDEQSAHERKHCVIHPNSNRRMAWDVVGLLMIVYDLVVIPLDQCFDPDLGFFGVIMDWAGAIFWTGDMLQGFFLGYFNAGKYVSNRVSILKHYLKTWFIIDLLIVVPDWIIIGLDSNQEGTAALEAGKIFKSARAIRILRLLRLLKLKRIIAALYDMIDSEWTFICIGLARLLLTVLALNHMIACLWFLVGSVNRGAGANNWIDVAELDMDDFWYKYSTSLHWSLTQFTPASMDVSARNTGERFFSIVVLFFAMVAFSSIIASITGLITSLRNMQNEELRNMWLLRRFLRQRKVSGDLSQRIFRFIENRQQQQSNTVHSSKVLVIGALSEALRDELEYELFMPTLSEHTWFNFVKDTMGVVMHRLCRTALTIQPYAEREVIFGAGDEGKYMYFIQSGVLDYFAANTNCHLSPPPHVKECASEAVLWTSWRHQGRLLSLTSCDLLLMDPEKLADVVVVHPKSWYYTKQYAVIFVKHLNALPPTEHVDIVRDASINAEAFDEFSEWARSHESAAIPELVDGFDSELELV
eukprot:TRINITY_DN15815_c0_g2_i1.p1 TRINITY_DN15815_c0_g2~~TRINITY_DN15815_c0_g2_i1.p1  ORF type:complete len:686 (+),score=109.45 TRINITY_DN15815_c0_g2_i1:54-2111(+)